MTGQHDTHGGMLNKCVSIIKMLVETKWLTVIKNVFQTNVLAAFNELSENLVKT